jgi:hypothetical protein
MELLFVIGAIILIVAFIKAQSQQSGGNNAEYNAVNSEQTIEKIESEILSTTPHTSLIDVTDEMKEQAIKSASKIQEKFGRKFEFSLQSIQDVEYFCEQAYQECSQRASKGEDVTQTYKTTAKIWGTYFGEVIRQNYGGTWAQLATQDTQSLPFIQIGNYSFDPYSPIHKRISEGSEHNILKYFKSTESPLATNRSMSDNFKNLQNAFNQLKQVNFIWQIITEEKTWDWRRNAGAGSLVARRQARIFQKNISGTNSSVCIIRSDEKNNFYSGNHPRLLELIFLIDKVVRIEIDKQGKVTKSNINYSDMQVSYILTQFIEEGTPPNDSQIVGHRWKYVKKDGGPDLRFSGNREIPIFQYGEISIDVLSNFTIFQVSNPSAGDTFCKILRSFLQNYKEPKQRKFEGQSNSNTHSQSETRNFQNKSSYEILGLKPNVTLDEIISAYRKLAQENHPDKVANMAPEFKALAEERMKVINSAYSELLKEHKK